MRAITDQHNSGAIWWRRLPRAPLVSSEPTQSTGKCVHTVYFAWRYGNIRIGRRLENSRKCRPRAPAPIAFYTKVDEWCERSFNWQAVLIETTSTTITPV